MPKLCVLGSAISDFLLVFFFMYVASITGRRTRNSPLDGRFVRLLIGLPCHFARAGSTGMAGTAMAILVFWGKKNGVA